MIKQGNTARIEADDLLLCPEVFIEKCIELLELPLSSISEVDRKSLSRKLRSGMLRVDAMNAIAALVSSRVVNDLSHLSTNALSHQGSFFASEMLTLYARNDDTLFLSYCFGRLAGREPTAEEQRYLIKALKRGVQSRVEVLEVAARIGSLAGLKVGVDSIKDHTQSEPAQFGLVGGVETVVHLDGRRSIVIVQFHPDLGWMIGQNVSIFRSAIVDRGWSISPGWVVVGPKVTFPKGTWRLSYEFRQPRQARMQIDVVANSGLDVMVKGEFEGPASGTLLFDIKAGQMFCEVRLFKPEQASELCWINLLNLCLIQEL